MTIRAERDSTTFTRRLGRRGEEKLSGVSRSDDFCFTGPMMLSTVVYSKVLEELMGKLLLLTTIHLFSNDPKTIGNPI